MNPDLDLSTEQDFDDYNFNEYPGLNNHILEEGISRANESLTDIVQHAHGNSQIIQEIGVEVLAQGSLIANQHKQMLEMSEKLGRIAILIKEAPSPTATITDQLQKIQEQQQILIKARRTQSTQTYIPGAQNISLKAIALLLVVQSVVTLSATVGVMRFIPPSAIASSELHWYQNAWYAIFQRVDGLYKQEFGNKPPK